MNNVETEPKEIIDESKSRKIIDQMNEQETSEKEIADLKNRVAKLEMAIQTLIDRGQLNPQDQEKF